MKIPLVLIHGWGVNSLIWQPIVERLESDFDTTLIDFPGYGARHHERFPKTLDALADDVLAQAPPTAIWAGWSLGGTVALAAALKHPQRIQKLQLIATTPKFVIGDGWEHGVAVEPFKKLAESFKKSYPAGLKKFLLLQSDKSPDAELSQVKALVRETHARLLSLPSPAAETLRFGLEILNQTDLRSQLPQVMLPTQVVGGTNDDVVPIAATQALANHLPQSQFVELKTGHLPFLQIPDAYCGLLRELAHAN